jgi:hypothetical protein
MAHHNPASILHHVLSRGITERREHTCHAVWQSLLSSNDATLLSDLTKFMDLPRQTRNLMKFHFPDQSEQSLDWIKQVQTGFFHQHLAGHWASFINHIHPHTIGFLELTANLLNEKLPTRNVDDVEIQKLIELFSAYITEVDSSKLEPTLKAYLARELNELQHLLRTYAITGALPPLRQVEALIGRCFTDQSYRNFLKDHELGKRLLDNLNAAAAVIAVAAGLPPLSQSIQLLLK